MQNILKPYLKVSHLTIQFPLVASKGTTSGISALEMLDETVDMIEGDQQRRHIENCPHARIHTLL